MIKSIQRCGVIAAFFLLLLNGCSDGTKARVMQFNDTKIRRLHNCYQLFVQRHNMTGPTSEEEFKSFLKSDAVVENLKLIDMDASMVDDLFISDRDGEPFVVKYGVNGYGPAIIFEAKGVEGIRMVALSPPKEVSDDAEYDRLLNGEVSEAEVADMNMGSNPEDQ